MAEEYALDLKTIARLQGSAKMLQREITPLTIRIDASIRCIFFHLHFSYNFWERILAEKFNDGRQDNIKIISYARGEVLRA
ncbi:hypothetical protein Syun_029340 [Stephania yunnanensis]|uniref:Uncharacterized protein n=1 Tax=Stephania yunnanensis TaxID=152371 RepID=A0AAP0E5F6_9MAGN